MKGREALFLCLDFELGVATWTAATPIKAFPSIAQY